MDRLAELVRQRSGASPIADLLLPALRDGSISVIAECTSEEHERLQVRMVRGGSTEWHFQPER